MVRSSSKLKLWTKTILANNINYIVLVHTDNIIQAFTVLARKYIYIYNINILYIYIIYIQTLAGHHRYSHCSPKKQISVRLKFSTELLDIPFLHISMCKRALYTKMKALCLRWSTIEGALWFALLPLGLNSFQIFSGNYLSYSAGYCQGHCLPAKVQ